MKQTLPRGFGLALAISLWSAVAVWVLLVVPIRGAPGSPYPGEGALQEPPPEKSLWDHVSAGAALLFHKETQIAREARKRAADKLGASAWRLAGHRGKGVKVAVLDSGFKGYTAALGKALPASVKVKSFRKDGQLEAKESEHGILCGEVIHHLAPEAELLFANWEPEQPESFLQAVRWARREGAQIISCSIIMPTWSDGEGRGAVHAALREALGAGNRREDALFFASAGNTAQRHWAGRAIPGKDGWHPWAPGKTDNGLKPVGKERVSVELSTNGSAVFDLQVRDTTVDRAVGLVRSRCEHDCCTAAVRFLPQPRHHYTVRVRSIADGKGKPTAPFHLTVLGGKLQYTVPAGSIPFPGDGAEVIAVGAVNERGRLFNYSSCGPKTLSLKPDLVATVPFPSVWRSYQAFGGTSAAAPQAAALAALLWSRRPEWTADRVRQTLCRSAVRGAKDHSTEFGFGLLRMPGVER